MIVWDAESLLWLIIPIWKLQTVKGMSLLQRLMDDEVIGIIFILASEVSVVFSVKVRRQAVFDCRLGPLPNESYVIDYFRWHQLQ